jgi:hypothetical protein
MRRVEVWRSDVRLAYGAKATVGEGSKRLLSATTDRNGTTVFLA